MTNITLPRAELVAKIIEANSAIVAETARSAVKDALQAIPAASSNVQNLMYDQAYYEVRDQMAVNLMDDENLPTSQLQAYEIACKSEPGLKETIKHLGLAGIAATHQNAARMRILSKFN